MQLWLKLFSCAYSMALYALPNSYCVSTHVIGELAEVINYSPNKWSCFTLCLITLCWCILHTGKT